MAVLVDATVGGEAANSYATIAEGNAYFETRLNASRWLAAADPDDLARALIQATRRIDQERFVGQPVRPPTGTTTGAMQALQWPRHGAPSPDGWDYLSTVIPRPIREATLELALYLLNQGTTDPSQPSGLEGFERVKVGALEITPRVGRAPDALPDGVVRLLGPMLVSSPNTVRLVRG